VISHKPRKTLPERVLSFLDEVNASHLYANQEYAIDELRRDIRVCTLATDKEIQSIFVHDKLVVEPGTVLTQQDKPYSVCTFLPTALVTHHSLYLPVGVLAIPTQLAQQTQC
jgi:deoxyribodipyrimidine photo-lyase